MGFLDSDYFRDRPSVATGARAHSTVGIDSGVDYCSRLRNYGTQWKKLQEKFPQLLLKFFPLCAILGETAAILHAQARTVLGLYPLHSASLKKVLHLALGFLELMAQHAKSKESYKKEAIH
eukprot:SAG22_NODE_1067_length_5742_cov_15.152224_8_plen_121_part_00